MGRFIFGIVFSLFFGVLFLMMEVTPDQGFATLAIWFAKWPSAEHWLAENRAVLSESMPIILAVLACGCLIIAIFTPLRKLASGIWRRFGISNSSEQLIGAVDAFNTILFKSKWAQNLRKRPDEMKLRGWYENSHTKEENIKRRLELHLDREIHDKLRAGELTAWGRTNQGNPLRPIPKEEWDEIEIMFDRESLTKCSKNACAWLRDHRLVPAGRIRYIEVQFPKTEIRKLFR